MKYRYLFVILTGLLLAVAPFVIRMYDHQKEETVVMELPELPTEVTLNGISYEYPGSLDEYLQHGWEFDSKEEAGEESYIRLNCEDGSKIELTAVKTGENTEEEIAGILIRAEDYQGEFDNPYGISFTSSLEDMEKCFAEKDIIYDVAESDGEQILQFYYGVSGTGQLIYEKDSMKSLYLVDCFPYMATDIV